MTDIAPRWSGADAAGGPVAGLDPRLRLLAALAFAGTVAVLETLPGAAVALAAATGLAAAARLPAVATIRRLAHVEGFMVVLLVLLPFTTPGTPLFTAGPVAASAEGLARACLIAMKVNAAVLATFALLGALEPVRLGRAAARLGAPARLVHLFLFAVRYVGVLRAETARLGEAMRARGFVPRSNRHTWRSLGTLVGMTLVRSIERAERVEEAMRCRGFTGRLPAVPAAPVARRDIALAVAMALALAALVAADRLR